MRKLFTLFFCILIIACQEPAKQNIDSSPQKSNQKVEEKEDKVDEIVKVEPNENKPEAKPKKELSITISVKEISFRDIQFKDTKNKMIEIMETADSIVEPKYECGLFSEDWQKMKFYQYFYGNMNFIVYQEVAEIQSITFLDSEQLKIKEVVLDGSMDLDTVVRKLGIAPKSNNYIKNRIMIYPKESLDEYYSLEFKEGKLFRFDRFEPC